MRRRRAIASHPDGAVVELEAPANSEIVLEGFIRAGYREQEGPFGEFSGYMSPGGQTPVIELTLY